MKIKSFYPGALAVALLLGVQNMFAAEAGRTTFWWEAAKDTAKDVGLAAGIPTALASAYLFIDGGPLAPWATFKNYVAPFMYERRYLLGGAGAGLAALRLLNYLYGQRGQEIRKIISERRNREGNPEK